jgi:hypothetical protein
MRSLKLRILAAGLLVGISCWCPFAWRANRNGDRTHHQNWRQYGYLASRLNALEHFLGGEIAFLSGVQGLKASYENKGNEEMEALIRSGYLVRLQFPVTNLAILREQVRREWFSLPDHGENNEGITGLNEASNLVTIVCRPDYALAFGELFAWRSPDSPLARKAEMALKLVPLSTKQAEAERILGRPTRYGHFRVAVTVEPAFAALTNDLNRPKGMTEAEVQNVWCDYYDLPGGGYVCLAFDAKATNWWAERPLIRIWSGYTNNVATIHFPK